MTYLLSSKTAYLLEQLLFKKDPNGPKRDYMRPVFGNGMTLIRSESQSSQMLWVKGLPMGACQKCRSLGPTSGHSESINCEP